ncbi:MAG: hypothetical protein ACOY3P_13465 [Planctomycetota bacterium]
MNKFANSMGPRSRAAALWCVRRLMAAFLAAATVVGAASGVWAQAIVPTDQIYSPFDAARDSFELGEAGRQARLNNQLGLVETGRAYRMWGPVWPPVYGAYPAVVYSYGSPRALWRAQRETVFYPPAIVAPRPFLWSPTPVAPLPGEVQQPIGHERIWTGPNSYIYKPLYPQPVSPAPMATAPAAQPQAQPQVEGPALGPPPTNGAESGSDFGQRQLAPAEVVPLPAPAEPLPPAPQPPAPNPPPAANGSGDREI